MNVQISKLYTANTLHDNCQVWIYAAHTTLTAAQQQYITEQWHTFADEWTSHQQKMTAQMFLYYNTFLVVVLDPSQAQASGCGIDKSVHFVKRLGAELNIDFLKRENIYFFNNENELQKTHFNKISSLYSTQQITASTLIFDNTINNNHQLKHNWIVPFSESKFEQLK
jgi:hypothetical protein